LTFSWRIFPTVNSPPASPPPPRLETLLSVEYSSNPSEGCIRGVPGKAASGANWNSGRGPLYPAGVTPPGRLSTVPLMMPKNTHKNIKKDNCGGSVVRRFVDIYFSSLGIKYQANTKKKNIVELENKNAFRQCHRKWIEGKKRGGRSIPHPSECHRATPRAQVT